MADPQIDPGEILLEWTFPEFPAHVRSRSWYLGFLLTVIVFAGYAVFAKNYTFLMIIVLLALILVMRFRQPPLDVTFRLREEGAEVGNRLYAWTDMKDFWILYRPPEVKKLYLEFKAVGRPGLDISLENQNPIKVRQILSQHLVENTEREEEPVGDQLTRYLKI